jgi:tetratricopeptide (TPR) repeat protein
LLDTAIPVIDGTRDPHLLLAAHHNLAASYIELGSPEEAIAVVDSIRDLYREHEEAGVRLKALWQQGSLLLAVGHLESAEKALSGARDGYIRLDLVHEVAEISLALAEVFRRKGDIGKCRKTLEEVVPIFRSLRFGPELLAALIRLQEAGQGDETLSP